MNRAREQAAITRQPSTGSSLTLPVLCVIVALHAQSGGSIEGKVVNASTGAALRRATVVLRPDLPNQDGPRESRDSYATETDSSGHFAFPNLAPGAYVCVPSKQGFADQPPDYLGSSYIQHLTVQKGSHVDSVLLRLTPLSVISGRVLDPEGDPVSGAVVEAVRYGYTSAVKTLQTRQTARSDDRGEYRLYGLYPGRYYLRAAGINNQGRIEIRGPRPLSLIQTFYPGTLDSTRATAIDIPAGGEMRAIDVRLFRQGLFSIQGPQPGGKSRDQLSLWIQRRLNEPGMPAEMGFHFRQDNNTWEVPGLAPGSYTITAERPDPARPGHRLFAKQTVEVVDRNIENTDLVFAPGLEISGTLRTAGTMPLPLESLRVLLLPVEDGVVRPNQPGPRVNAPVKADGTFTLPDVLPDLYQLRLNPPNTAYVKSIKWNDHEVAEPRIDLRGGVPGPLALVVSADMGRVDGIVRDDQGTPVAGANVTLNPDESKSDWLNRYRNMVTDAQGRFFFKNMTPGRYQLFAWRDNPRGAPADREFRKPFESFSVTVDMEPNGLQTVELKAIATEQRPR